MSPEAAGAVSHGLIDSTRAVAFAIQSSQEAMAILESGAIFATNASGIVALTGGLMSIAGDDDQALIVLRRAVEIGRDFGTRPQLSAALDWCLRPLIRTGDAEAASVFVSALEQGALADVGRFPSSTARARTLERARTALGVEAVDACFALGADLEFDQVIAYALEHLSFATQTPT